MGTIAEIGQLYAAAIFELARESRMVDAVRNDLLALTQVAKTEKEFLEISVSPYFSQDSKRQLLQTLFAGHVADMTMDFLQVVNKHNRMAYLPLIADEYEKLRDAYVGCSLVDATFANQMSEPEIARFTEEIKAAFQSEVKLVVRVDPSIIGGVILRRGDMIVDNTVKRELLDAVKAITSRRKNQEISV
jgi:F-type H+-transporting ATPase subunit delta